MSQVDTRGTDSLVKEQLALLIERELRYRLDDILREMQKLAENHQIGGGTQRSPLRNLLVAATDRTASLEIIKNYISYQTARSEDVGKILKATHKGKKFGDALIDALDGLNKNAEDILDHITDSLTDDKAIKQYLTPQVRSRVITDLHLKLAQLYLGYLVREHTALRESQSNNQSKPEVTQPKVINPTARPHKSLGSDRSQQNRPRQ